MWYRHARAAVSQACRVKSTAGSEFCTGRPRNHRTFLLLRVSPFLTQSRWIMSSFRYFISYATSSRDQTFNAFVERKSTAIDDADRPHDVSSSIIRYCRNISIDRANCEANPILHYRGDHQPWRLFKSRISFAFPRGFSSSRVKEARHRTRLLQWPRAVYSDGMLIRENWRTNKIVRNVEFSFFFFLDGSLMVSLICEDKAIRNSQNRRLSDSGQFE